ncbi:MAG: TonB-dependent receptor plug domain-containing protein [Anaeromyxobacteraceae bacterium]
MNPRLSSLAALALAIPCAARALDSASGAELALFDLDAQLQAETTVASAVRARSVRETPGVVTVLTRDELRSAGARDLLEALTLLVPGFQAGVDVTGVVDVGFRGLWAHEGKVLLLLDGIEMNELLFGTLQLGHHYPIENIQTLEVIRGPGSALYGGSAELAVVRITTRGARDLDGASIAGGYGASSSGTLSRRDASASLAGFAGEASYAVHATVGQGNRSDRRYVDTDGAGFAMGGQAALDPAQVNAHASWRGLELRLLYDDYSTTTRDGYGATLERPADQRFRTAAADASWRFTAGALTVTPRATYKRDTPWQTDDQAAGDLYYDKSADRLSGGVTLALDRGDLTAVAGAEARHDRAWLRGPAALQTQFGGSDRADYTNLAAFAEVGWETPWVNVLAGARAEHHSAAGGAFVPRLALTKLWHPLHVKLLYARAFRAPAIENVSQAPTSPERTTVGEAEVGWEISDHAYLGVNAFDAHIDGPIVFTANADTGVDVYRNGARTGSRGVEAELRLAGRDVSVIAQYAFYTAAHQNAVATYAVPGHDDLLLGFAAHRATFLARLALPGRLTLAPSLVVTSRRYAYTTAAGDPTALPASARANLFASWRDLFARGLEVGAGVYDLFDAGTTYPQPYASGHAPLPGQGRELYVRLSWDAPR